MLRYQEQPGLQYTKEIFDLKLIKKMTWYLLTKNVLEIVLTIRILKILK